MIALYVQHPFKHKENTMRIPVYDAQGKRTQEILEFDEKIFGETIRRELLKEAVLMYEARQRVGSHATKTRGECSGTGRKLWRQKGTGRARVGPARAPHWKGGGVVFGPHPRDYSYAMPKKARKGALNSAWLAKLLDKEILVIEGFDLQTAPKTSRVFKTLQVMETLPQKTLIGIADYNQVLWQSVRNISNVSLEKACNFSPYVLLSHKWIVIQRQAFEELIKSRGGDIKVLQRKEVYS
jgi:large subunit ribosomal protein L4